MKAKRIVTGIAIALVVAVGLALPEAASADRGSRGGGGTRGAVVVKGGGFHGHGGRAFVRSGHRSSFGVVVGVPWVWGGGWYGGYYPPYYYGGYYGPYGYPGYGYPGYGYYPPAVVAAPASPPTYIERGTSESAPGGSEYWYYCDQSRAYYPYVKECPGGWRREVPQPPPDR